MANNPCPNCGQPRRLMQDAEGSLWVCVACQGRPPNPPQQMQAIADQFAFSRQLGIASIILGVVALVLFSIPDASGMVAGIGVMVGLVGFVKSQSKHGVGLGVCLAGIGLSCLGFIPIGLFAFGKHLQEKAAFQRELEQLQKGQEFKLKPFGNSGDPIQWEPGSRLK